MWDESRTRLLTTLRRGTTAWRSTPSAPLETSKNTPSDWSLSRRLYKALRPNSSALVEGSSYAAWPIFESSSGKATRSTLPTQRDLQSGAKDTCVRTIPTPRAATMESWSFRPRRSTVVPRSTTKTSRKPWPLKIPRLPTTWNDCNRYSTTTNTWSQRVSTVPITK